MELNNTLNFLMVDITALFLVIAYDSTRKSLLDELKVLLERAELSDKTKDMFIAAMSHEFRNPLNSLLCSIDVLKEAGLERLSHQQLELISTM